MSWVSGLSSGFCWSGHTSQTAITLPQNIHSLPNGHSWKWGNPTPQPLFNWWKFNWTPDNTNQLYLTYWPDVKCKFLRIQWFRWSKLPPGTVASFRRNPEGESEIWFTLSHSSKSLLHKEEMCSMGQIICFVKAKRGPRPRRVISETTHVSSIPGSSKIKLHVVLLNMAFGNLR